MRIAYLAADTVPSVKGAGRRIARTVKALQELGHQVSLFTPAAAGTDEERLDGVDHTTVSLAGEKNFLDRKMAFRQAAAAWLEQQQAEVVQFRSIWEGLPAVAWARGKRAKVVFEVHGFPSVELPYHYPGLEHSRVMDKLIAEEGRVLAEADLVLTHSRTGRRFLQMRGLPAERVALVPNAVDPQLFSPAPAAPEGEVPFRLVYVGTMAPWQGLPLLLESLPRFRGSSLELHVIGPRKSLWRRQLRQLARRVRVHHQLHLSAATSQENLVPVLRNAHVCVAPMPADPRNALQGFCPIKVLEYLAVGRPVLATRIAPLEEILQDRRTALLVRPGSPAALADGIAWLLGHPAEREELGRNARLDVLARWTPQHFTVRLADAFERLSSS